MKALPGHEARFPLLYEDVPTCFFCAETLQKPVPIKNMPFGSP